MTTIDQMTDSPAKRVELIDLLKSSNIKFEYPNALQAVIGQGSNGESITIDFQEVVHLLIAGTTASGKTMCLHALIISLITQYSPDQVKLLLFDSLTGELGFYRNLPHLLNPFRSDDVEYGLIWILNEIECRASLFIKHGVRDINAYQCKLAEEQMPHILVIIDNFTDPIFKDKAILNHVNAIAAKGRAAGVHLVLATQWIALTKAIKSIFSNLTTRIIFHLPSNEDSRFYLNQPGAESLVSCGEMICRMPGSANLIHGQGAFISITDIRKQVDEVSLLYSIEQQAKHDSTVQDHFITDSIIGDKPHDASELDELLPQALGIVVEAGYASVSLLQRRMNVGYPRAARLIDRMNEAGYIGPFEGSKPRRVFLTSEQLEALMIKD